MEKKPHKNNPFIKLIWAFMLTFSLTMCKYRSDYLIPQPYEASNVVNPTSNSTTNVAATIPTPTPNVTIPTPNVTTPTPNVTTPTIPTITPPNPVPSFFVNGIDTREFDIRVFQTIREGGVKFRFQAIKKINGHAMDTVKFSYQNLEPAIPIKINGNTVVGLNNDGGRTRVRATLVSRDGISKTIDVWSDTGNHDGQSTNCNDNEDYLVATNHHPEINSVITITWMGTLEKNQFLNWFGDNFVLISRTDKTITLQLKTFPFWIQAQPTAVPSNNYCHGWTGLYFL